MTPLYVFKKAAKKVFSKKGLKRVGTAVVTGGLSETAIRPLKKAEEALTPKIPKTPDEGDITSPEEAIEQEQAIEDAAEIESNAEIAKRFIAASSQRGFRSTLLTKRTARSSTSANTQKRKTLFGA